MLAGRAGYGETCYILLDNGADPTLVDNRGQTAIKHAANNDIVQIIQAAIRKHEEKTDMANATIDGIAVSGLLCSCALLIIN